MLISLVAFSLKRSSPSCTRSQFSKSIHFFRQSLPTEKPIVTAIKMTSIIDGTDIARQVREELKLSVQKLHEELGMTLLSRL